MNDGHDMHFSEASTNYSHKKKSIVKEFSYRKKHLLRRTASEPIIQLEDYWKMDEMLDVRKNSYDKEKEKEKEKHLEPTKLEKKFIRFRKEENNKSKEMVDSPYNEVFFSKLEYLLRDYLNDRKSDKSEKN